MDKILRNRLHDIVLDLTGQSENSEVLNKIYDSVPDTLKSLGEQYGYDDSDFRSNLWDHLENQLKSK